LLKIHNSFELGIMSVGIDNGDTPRPPQAVPMYKAVAVDTARGGYAVTTTANNNHVQKWCRGYRLGHSTSIGSFLDANFESHIFWALGSSKIALHCTKNYF